MTTSLVAELSKPDGLRSAWEAVQANRGVPGIDRESVGDFASRLEERLAALAAEIGAGSYRPLPVLRIRPAFLGESDRALVVPAVRDRVVLRAVADRLQGAVDPLLPDACCAFRKGRPIQGCADRVGGWAAEGFAWALRADVRHFFDTIRPELLLERLQLLVDPADLPFLKRLLHHRVFDHHALTEAVVGIPQGSPLSPLLANFYLHELDRGIQACHPRYLRYCDDMIVMERDEAGASSALERLEAGLAPLGLSLNREKTRICRLEDGLVFLGYHFGPAGRGPSVKAVEALRFRLGEIEAEEQPDLAGLDALHRGWTAYFGPVAGPWLSTAAGILALLRQPAGPDVSAEMAEKAAAARAGLARSVPIGLSLPLATAWSAVGREEQAWLEFARVVPGHLPPAGQLERWSELLRTPADRLRGLAEGLAGEHDGRLALLAEAASQAGRYEVGRRIAALDPAALGGQPAGADGSSDRDSAPLEVDPGVLREWFRGRDGIHGVETVDGRGHRRFVVNNRPLLDEEWRAHLAGEATLAVALVREDQTVLCGAFDIDVERRDLDERFGRPDDLLGRALGCALRLKAALASHGCGGVLEFSGRKGYHVWIRFDAPVPLTQAVPWLRQIADSVRPWPEAIRIELFPGVLRVKPGDPGPLLKLPLGIHSSTGRRCLLLDDRGEPVADPEAEIRRAARMPVEKLAGAGPAPQAAEKETDGGPPPRVGAIYDGCAVVRRLKEKARATLYLTHSERYLLLCTFGHLGDESRKEIHTVVSHCHNYRSEVTDRHIERMKPSPISCARIRELHPDITASVGCDCRFRLHGRGYPTPVLHALKPAQVEGFAARRQPTGSVPDRQPRPEGGPPQGPAKGPEKPVPVVDEPRPGPEDRAAIEAVVRRIAEQRRQMRGLEKAMDKAREELAALFDRCGLEAVETAAGCLRRRKSESGGWTFTIEV